MKHWRDTQSRVLPIINQNQNFKTNCKSLIINKYLVFTTLNQNQNFKTNCKSLIPINKYLVFTTLTCDHIVFIPVMSVSRSGYISTSLAKSGQNWPITYSNSRGGVVKGLIRSTKRCENASASVKLNYRSLPVGPRLVRMIDVSTYEGADFMGDRLRHGVQLSLVPRA